MGGLGGWCGHGARLRVHNWPSLLPQLHGHLRTGSQAAHLRSPGVPAPPLSAAALQCWASRFQPAGTPGGRLPGSGPGERCIRRPRAVVPGGPPAAEGPRLGPEALPHTMLPLPQVYKGVSACPPQRPYLCHTLPGPSHGLRFCPFEDVLGVGHEQGFASLLVPGKGAAADCPAVGGEGRGGWVAVLWQRSCLQPAHSRPCLRRRCRGAKLRRLGEQPLPGAEAAAGVGGQSIPGEGGRPGTPHRQGGACALGRSGCAHLPSAEGPSRGRGLSPWPSSWPPGPRVTEGAPGCGRSPPLLFLTACPPPQIPPELISLDPGQLGQVDAVSLEQQREERAERLVRAQAGGCRWHSSGCSGRMGWCKTRLCWALGSRALSLCPPPPPGLRPRGQGALLPPAEAEGPGLSRRAAEAKEEGGSRRAAGEFPGVPPFPPCLRLCPGSFPP